MRRVLVLGAAGMLGASLVPLMQREGHDVVRQSRGPDLDEQVDPGSFEEMLALCRRCEPDAVVNLVAATDVDACERDPAQAYAGNVRPATVLAAVAARLDKRPALVHVSTDHVYDGTGPHDEDVVQPINEYALSKLAAEGPILAAGGTVLRTNFIGRSRSPQRRGLTDWLWQKLSAGERVTGFDNVLVSAVHASVLCGWIERVARHPRTGVYNAGCLAGGSKAEIACRFATRLRLPADLISHGVFRAGDGVARRPLDMRMSSRKFSQTFDITLPAFEEQIDLAAGDYDD